VTGDRGRALILTKDLLAKVKRQAAAADACPSCEWDPVLAIRTCFVEIYLAHAPGCPEDVRSGGETVPTSVLSLDTPQA
jgi:hypothetical protein